MLLTCLLGCPWLLGSDEFHLFPIPLILVNGGPIFLLTAPAISLALAILCANAPSGNRKTSSCVTTRQLYTEAFRSVRKTELVMLKAMCLFFNAQ